MRTRTAITIAAMLAAAPALAATPTDFTCRNRNAQISCDSVRCEINTDSFTPMSVSRSANRLEICAYSGCRSGALDLIRTRGELTILHASLSEDGGSLAVTFDSKLKIATVLWGEFAQAMSCGEEP